MDAIQEKPIIWITLINNGYVHYTKNFLKSMEINNCSFHLLVYCLDNESMAALEGLPNISCLSAKPFMRTTMNKSLTTWKTIDYKRIVFAKLDAIKHTLEKFKGSTVGYIDTDIIVFKDPTPIMLEAMYNNPEAIVISQCDEEGSVCKHIFECPNICSGVIVFRQSFITTKILNYTNMDIIKHLTDQHYLTDILKKLNIKYMTISKDIFVNGSYPGVRDDGRPLILPQTAALLHYNFMIGAYKEASMKKNGMWYI